jgi:hypothetical protein
MFLELQGVTNPVILPAICCIWDIPVLHKCMKYLFISHAVGPTDLLHSSPTSHFKTFLVLLIHFQKCASCNTMPSYAAIAAL